MCKLATTVCSLRIGKYCTCTNKLWLKFDQVWATKPLVKFKDRLWLWLIKTLTLIAGLWLDLNFSLLHVSWTPIHQPWPLHCYFIHKQHSSSYTGIRCTSWGTESSSIDIISLAWGFRVASCRWFSLSITRGWMFSTEQPAVPHNAW